MRVRLRGLSPVTRLGTHCSHSSSLERIGYALAWMIHSERRNRDRHVPDYARTRHGYASQGDA